MTNEEKLYNLKCTRWRLLLYVSSSNDFPTERTVPFACSNIRKKTLKFQRCL